MIHCITNHSGYAAKRSFLNLPFEGVRVEKRVDPFKLLDYAHYRLRGESDLFLHNLWFDIGQHQLVHLRNGISLGRSPWVVSFEDFLPRWSVSSESWIPQAMKCMAGERCKALIAQSRAARDRQLFFIERHQPELRATIESKLHVLLPPQELLLTAYDDKPLTDSFVDFALVGHDFFRKGGREVLRAFDRLLREGAPVRLSIVSKLEYGDYASRTTIEDVQEARMLIERHRAHVTHFERLPYSEVVALYRRSHVGLLPTWSDTFGYSVLEAQAAGCPVITTDVNALPEVNSDATGWLISVPKHEWKAHGSIDTEDGRRVLSERIEHGIYAAVEDVLANPDGVRQKGERCLQRIRDEHDPVAAATFLAGIYQQALT